MQRCCGIGFEEEVADSGSPSVSQTIVLGICKMQVEDIPSPSRKGKERETSHRDLAMREPQPTDLDEKLMALRRRTAAFVILL
jgi:hypothetical protein